MDWIINLSPQGYDAPDELTLYASGATLSINGAELDLSFMDDGDMLPPGAIDHPLLRGAEIRRVGDVIEIDALLFPISLNQTNPAACFPEPVLVTEDGPIQLPPQAPPAPEPEVTESEGGSDANQH